MCHRPSWCTAAAILFAAATVNGQAPQRTEADKPKSPIVLLVGCAHAGAQPNIWTLSNVGERTESPTPAISTADNEAAAGRALGQNTYQLIGVADFVDADQSRKIGVRGEILTPGRVNTTGKLADGHKVAVKGLYIEATPPRVNLTSVVDLATACP